MRYYHVWKKSPLNKLDIVITWRFCELVKQLMLWYTSPNSQDKSASLNMSGKGDFLKKKKNCLLHMVFARALYKSHPVFLHVSLPSITLNDFPIFQNQKQSICMSWKTALKTPYNIIHGVPPAHSFIFSVFGMRHMNFVTRISMPVSPPIPLFFFIFKRVFSQIPCLISSALQKRAGSMPCAASRVLTERLMCVCGLYVSKVVYISPSILTPLVSLSTSPDFTILQNTTTHKTI
jgi:hypothetical protein